MPTYEYRCLKCRKKFDYFQSMSSATLKKCIFCAGKVERMIGAGAGLIFKGTGFYQTDYKRQPAKEPAGPSSGGKTEDRGQKTENREQRTEDRKQKTEKPKKETASPAANVKKEPAVGK